MDTNSVISILGSLASIVGGGFAWWQFKRAKKIADQIRVDRVRRELPELKHIAESSREDIKKLISYLQSEKQSRGLNLEDVLKTIQNLIEKFNDNKHLFNDNSDIQTEFENLIKSFDEYKKIIDTKEKLKSANDIYKYINNIISEINKSFDEKIIQAD